MKRYMEVSIVFLELREWPAMVAALKAADIDCGTQGPIDPLRKTALIQISGLNLPGEEGSRVRPIFQNHSDGSVTLLEVQAVE